MSRSKAKTYRFFSVDKVHKKKANKIVRRTCDVPDGSSYKKLYETWKICDDKPHIITPSDEFAEGMDRK